MTERWAPIEGWPEYNVSDHGRVRRVVPGSGAVVGRVLRPWAAEGYPKVALWRGGERVAVFVHALVAGAFLPPPGEGQTQIAHGNGTRSDPRAANLRRASPVENAKDRHAHGTHFVGEANPAAKLCEARIRAIRTALGAGYSQRRVAAEFGVAQQTVSRIGARAAWAHVS